METLFVGDNYAIWNTPLLTHDEFVVLSLFDQLKYFVTFGTMAPNTHNAQPWAFVISSEEYSITVCINRERVLPASDKDGRQSLVSLGAAIENIVTCAAAVGKQCELKMVNNEKNVYRPLKDVDTQKITPVAILHFFDTSPSDDRLFQAIPKRKVVRADYDREKIIDPHIIEEIQKSVSTPEIELHLVGDPLRRQAMAEFQGQADSYVINSKTFSRELGDWLLPNDTPAALGMPGAGFGLQADQAVRMHRALRGEEKLQPEDGLKFALAGKFGMEKSPFIGFLTAAEDSPALWIEAGKTLERIFLICTSYGICTAVHAGVVEVALINRIFAATLGTTKRITAVFRMGYIKDVKDLERPHAPRLPVEEVIYKPSPQTSFY